MSASAADSKPARNDPCPCGSGRKYKKCCGGPTAAAPRPSREQLAELQKLEQAGRFREAGMRYQELLRTFVDHPALLWGHGRCLMQFELREPAAAVLERAVRVYPLHEIMVQDVLGRLIILGKPDVALRLSVDAVRRFPDNDSILMHRADALRLLDGEDEAIVLIRRILSRNAAVPGARQSLVNCLRHTGQSEEARTVATASLREAGGLTPLERAGLENELAHIADAAGDSAAALAHLRESGAILLSTPQAQRVNSDTYFSRLAAYTATLDSGMYPTQPLPADERDARLTFVLGFPRSGTTLLESVLSVPDGVQSSGENQLIDAALSVFLSPDSGVDGLLEAVIRDDGSRRAAARDAFWQKISMNYGDRFTHFIDKQPMNTLYLPHIRLLFPGARIVFCARDPRDVCLSCYFQWFALNGTNKLFLDWHQTADFYGRLMDYWMRFAPLAGDKVFLLKYEDLVADFEGSVRRLAADLQLPWDDAMLRFDKLNRERYFNTPSARAIREGIRTDRAQRWENYREAMLEVGPLLDPAISYFGYPPTVA